MMAPLTRVLVRTNSLFVALYMVSTIRVLRVVSEKSEYERFIKYNNETYAQRPRRSFRSRGEELCTFRFLHECERDERGRSFRKTMTGAVQGTLEAVEEKCRSLQMWRLMRRSEILKFYRCSISWFFFSWWAYLGSKICCVIPPWTDVNLTIPGIRDAPPAK
nr:hypothetical protein F42C5.1 - Caenorhabditis elegans [Caenorhabditis elegans]